MKKKKNQFLLRFSGNNELEPEAFPGWDIIQGPDAKVFWDNVGQFKDSTVVFIQSNDNERGRIIPAARQVMEVTGDVRILKISKDSEVTIDDLDRARPIPDVFLDMTEEDLANLTDVKNITILHPAQDYDDGLVSYGVKIKGKDYLVFSKPELIPLLECPSRDIQLIQSHLSMSGFSQSAVLDFMSGAENGTPDSVHREIVDYLKNFIFFPNPEYFDMLAVWIMGTYIYRTFRYYPYLHLNAEKGSGKTLLMELMSPIAFNGVLLSQPPASTMLKLIEQDSASLFIDEVEGLGANKSSGGQLKAILKTGFARSGVYYNGDVMFRTFCSKCFAGINLLDDVLADRTIIVRLLRKTGRDKTKIYRETPLMRKDQSDLRDKLYHFGLRYGPQIAADYHSETTMYDELPHLTNRAYDIWVPLFKIVNSIDDETYKSRVFQSLDHLSQTDARRRAVRDSDENETGTALEMVDEALKYVEPEEIKGRIKYYDPDKIHMILQREGIIKKSVERKALSRMLKKVLDIDCVPRPYGLKSKRLYMIDMNEFEEYKRRYAPPVTDEPAV